MGKTYIDIVKYMVEARFEITGLVEKPDIIGAVFGQTEGLLGSDLDLRELQKNGKIGRIEIDTNASGSRTIGKLHLPSSLGRVETCILAAAIESVDRVGPFETHFKIDKIEDTRSEKRKKIVDRAKELMKIMLNTEIPDSREISDMVEVEIKSSAVTDYGPEKLSAGPEVDSSEDIILVEGRADVIALLKSDILNCVAIGGATGTIPKTVITLVNTKETTLFLDGDRGGDIILKGIMNIGEIDYVARAPDGKEVEELTRKEIIKALRSRVPIEQLFPGMKKNGNGGEHRTDERSGGYHQQPQQQSQQQSRPMPQRDTRQTSSRPQQSSSPQYNRPSTSQSSATLSPTEISNNLLNKNRSARQPIAEPMDVDTDLGIKDLSGRDNADEGNPMGGIPSIASQRQGSSSVSSENQKYVAALDELHNTLRGRLYGTGGEMISEVPIRELIQAIEGSKNIGCVVFDGIITQRLIELAYKSGVKEIYGIRASQITRTYDGMYLYTKEHGKI
ncbi:MAG: DNA primase DnaG [Candidatus Micrarchaeales archaeon]